MCVGCSEVTLALATLAPSRPHREWAYNLLGVLTNGLLVAHYHVKDGKETPALVMLMVIVYLRFYDFAAKFSRAYAAEIAKAKAR